MSFCVVDKNASNKNIPIVNEFSPSQMCWVFKWMMGAVIPTFLDKEALLKTSVICTDNEKELVGAVINCIGVPNISKYGKKFREKDYK